MHELALIKTKHFSAEKAKVRLSASACVASGCTLVSPARVDVMNLHFGQKVFFGQNFSLNGGH
jgi:hypothetical protein